ncbi:hypothetical protein [Phaeacidiphilus oryzae]|uniref:hypothetical protein n=1 Tax=Phaeacidiphilus oryzae TaxID=348818 RepID=UPI000689E85F|nr:hypothetical protein [Phaeacidiphilus oryzae]
MHALTYEWRRLTGLRSTWWVGVLVLAAGAAVELMTVRHLLGGAHDPVRAMTAAVPLLPLPLAALGAGAVGALSAGREARDPSLLPLVLSPWRRLRLLTAKLVLVAGYALALGLLTELGGLLLLRFARPDGRAMVGMLDRSPAPYQLAGFLALSVAAGWIGLLAAAVFRAAAAGMLAVLVVPVLVQPLGRIAARAAGRAGKAGASGAGGAGHGWHGLLPYGSGRGWVFGPLSGLRAAADTVPGTAALAAVAGAAVPVVLLLVGYLVLLPRRRGL